MNEDLKNYVCKFDKINMHFTKISEKIIEI